MSTFLDPDLLDDEDVVVTGERPRPAQNGDVQICPVQSAEEDVILSRLRPRKRPLEAIVVEASLPGHESRDPKPRENRNKEAKIKENKPKESKAAAGCDCCCASLIYFSRIFHERRTKEETSRKSATC